MYKRIKLTEVDERALEEGKNTVITNFNRGLRYLEKDGIAEFFSTYNREPILVGYLKEYGFAYEEICREDGVVYYEVTDHNLHERYVKNAVNRIFRTMPIESFNTQKEMD